MAAQNSDRLPGCRIPDGHRAVEACRRQQLAIRAERNGVHAAGGRAKALALAAGRGVPDPQVPIRTTGGNQMTCRVKGHTHDVALVSPKEQRATGWSLREVPDADGSVLARRRELLAVRAP